MFSIFFFLHYFCNVEKEMVIEINIILYSISNILIYLIIYIELIYILNYDRYLIKPYQRFHFSFILIIFMLKKKW